jgi:hypothetical protein
MIASGIDVGEQEEGVEEELPADEEVAAAPEGDAAAVAEGAQA